MLICKNVNCSVCGEGHLLGFLKSEESYMDKWVCDDCIKQLTPDDPCSTCMKPMCEITGYCDK